MIGQIPSREGAAVIRSLTIDDAEALKRLLVANREPHRPFQPLRSEAFFTVEAQRDRLGTRAVAGNRCARLQNSLSIALRLRRESAESRQMLCSSCTGDGRVLLSARRSTVSCSPP
jgi:hypothetical protein